MPPSPKKLPVETATPTIIRQLFNNGRFFEKVKSGEFTTKMKRNSHPANPPGNMPVCTRSQTLCYCKPNGQVVAIVHQYLQPDGTVGASGLPDPKYLVLEDRILYLKQSKP